MATLARIVQINPSTKGVLDQWDFARTARGLAFDGRNFYIGDVPVSNKNGTLAQYRLRPNGASYLISTFTTATKSTGVRGITYLGGGMYFMLSQSLGRRFRRPDRRASKIKCHNSAHSFRSAAVPQLCSVADPWRF